MLKRYGRLMIATSLVSLLPTIAGLILWNHLPEQVPIHFDFEGNPDNYGSRAFAVFFIPLFLLAMQWLCLLITRTDPKRRNVSPKVMTLVLWICPLISVLVGVIMYASALGAQLALGRIMPVLFGLLFVAIGNYLPKCKQNYTVGIKLPWTLNDEENWNRTHRFAGYVWTIGGIVLAITGLAGMSNSAFLMILLLGMVLSAGVYSYVLYRKKCG